jgi:hypothetical protein
MRTGTRLLTCLATVAPAGVPAQSLHLDLIPAAAYHSLREELGAAALIGNSLYVGLGRPDASAALGATAEMTRSGHWLGARLTGLFTLPASTQASFHCRPGLFCVDVLLGSGAEVTTANLLADLVVELWDSGPLRQWLAVGAGLRHYDISWDAPSSVISAGSHSETIAALHFGVGVDVRLGPGALRVSMGGLWSAEGDRVPPAAQVSPFATSVAGRAAQRDLLLSLGWRLLRF